MPKHYKEMMDEIINKIDEDAPANAAGSGNIAGIGVGPDGEPGVNPTKAMKRKKENEKEQDQISKKISKMVKENNDNNNVIFKQILDTIDKVETKIDEKNGFVKTDVTVELIEDKYVSFREKYNAKKS